MDLTGLSNKQQCYYTVWKESLRPWLKTSILACLFLVSLVQSASYLAKFLNPSVVSTVSLRRVQPEDTPWITICHQPSYNLTKMAQFLDEGIFTKGEFALYGFTGQMLYNATSKLNMSMDDFLNLVGIPLWLELDSCAARSFSYSRTDCSKFRMSDGNKLTSGSPMTHETPAGTWETEFFLRWRNIFNICSTLKPNFTLDAGDKFSITIKTYIKWQSNTQNEFLRPKVQKGDAVPRYGVYITEPYLKPLVYQFNDVESHWVTSANGRSLLAGESVFLQLHMESFQFLSSPSKPCTSDEDALEDRHQCVTQCFESKFLQSTCRLPGFRKPHLPENFLLPPICHTPEDYKQWVNQKWHDDGWKLQQDCDKICPRPCSRLQYDIRTTRLTEEAIFNFTDILEDSKYRLTKIEMTPASVHVKTIVQQYAYDIHQFVGDLGGSWGLLLGLSIMNLLQWLDSAIWRILN